MLIVTVVILGVAFYVMTPEERNRALRPAGIAVRYVRRGAELGSTALRLILMGLIERQRWAIATLSVATLLILTAAGHVLYVRSFADVRPEIERVFAIEEKTVRAYDSAVGQFTLGALSAEALSNVIQHTVLPELRDARARLRSLGRVRPEHQRVLVTADEYLQLRIVSWQSRAEALGQRSMGGLSAADRSERTSLAALQALRQYELQ
jgi:hypothetical protein